VDAVNDLEKILRPKGLGPAKLQVQIFLFTTYVFDPGHDHGARGWGKLWKNFGVVGALKRSARR